jgi:hypothetical protein
VVARELGLPAPKLSRHRDDQRRPDGAEGSGGGSAGRVAATGSDSTTPARSHTSSAVRDLSSQLAQSKVLSEDAKRLFTDLQLGKFASCYLCVNVCVWVSEHSGPALALPATTGPITFVPLLLES